MTGELLGKLLIRYQPDPHDLVDAAAGEVFAVAGNGEAGGFAFVGWDAGDEGPFFILPNPHSAIGMTGEEMSAIGEVREAGGQCFVLAGNVARGPDFAADLPARPQ